MSATLKDVALKCGLDISTVSRALRGDPRVKDKTKIKVKEIAESLNYSPNLAARSLAAGKTKTICLLVGSLSNHLEVDAVHIASSYMIEKNYDVSVFVHNNNLDVYKRLLNRLHLASVDGAIIIPNFYNEGPELYKNLLDSNVPFVFFDRHIKGIECPVYTIDNYEGSKKLLQKCFAAGIEKSYVLYGENKNVVESRRREGAIDFLTKNKIDFECIPADDLVLKNKIDPKYKKIGIHSTQQYICQDFLSYNKDCLSDKEIYFTVFDKWLGQPYPAKKTFVAIQDIDQLMKKTIDAIITTIENELSPDFSITRVPILKIQEINNQF